MTGPHRRNLRFSTATTIAVVALVTVVALGIPSGYYIIKTETERGGAELDATAGAYQVGERAARNPELWQFEEVRLQPLVKPYRDASSRAPLNKLIVTADGTIVASHIEFPRDSPFFIRESMPIFVNGQKSGDFIVERSTLFIVKHTALLGTFSLIAALFLLSYLVLFPARRMREAEHDQWWAAHHDHLTGLLNRSAFLTAIESHFAEARRDGTYVALLFADLDHFKSVNETHGHAAGDRLLIEAARRLRQHVRSSDTVGRIGGDEFVLAFPGLREASVAERMAKNILHALSEPYVLGSTTAVVRASVGIALFPNHADNAADLLRHADTAMYRVKASSRNAVATYRPEEQSALDRRFRILQEGAQAMQHGEFAVHYQPIIDTRTGRTCGYESLARWQHRELGAVSPAEFIPLFEENGQIRELGQWLARTVFQTMRQNLGRDGGDCRVSLNVSPHELNAPQFAENLIALLHETDTVPDLVKLEVTEGVLIRDPDATLRVMQQLRDIGVGFVIDDFGTGYSSLTYLRRFPLEGLKIDRSFILALERSTSERSIVRAIINLAHELGLHVTAEGVETATQANILAELQCDAIQGFFTGPPMPFEQLPAHRSGIPHLRLAHSTT